MASCCGRRKARRGADSEPLLPRYEDETARQRQLHQKLHSYQVFRALSEGYLPSTEQAIANLRTLLASDVLNPRSEDLSESGRLLSRDVKLWLRCVIELLQEKNSQDQLQEFLWHLFRSRASLDTSELVNQASYAKAKADTKAGERLAKPYGSTPTLSSTSPDRAGADEGQCPTEDDLRQKATDIPAAAEQGISQAGHQAVRSAWRNLSGDQRDALLYRLKQTILNLRTRTDYSDAVSTLSRLVQRYGKLYANAAENTLSAVNEDVDVNADLREAVDRFWALVRSFGNPKEWELLEERFHGVMSHAHKDPEFERLVSEIGASLQEMLTDPSFFDSASERLDELKDKSKALGSETALRHDVDAFLQQIRRTLKTIPDDPAVAKVVAASKKIYDDLWGAYNNKTSSLVADVAHVFLPLLIRSIQHIPIPRLEISVPEMDLLVENLVLEPGRTVHSSSFFPYKIRVTSRTDMELAKVHSKRAKTDLKTIVTVSVSGLNISASEFGYWLRAHSGPLFRFKDEGIASFYLDQRGIDISVDLEIGRERLASLIVLRGVRVHIHKLEYQVQRSKWKFLLWIVKPFLKQLVRRVLEKKIAEQVVVALTTLNRELVFARERLRAVRIANPQDLSTFIRAVLARPKSWPDPNVYKRMGFSPPDRGIFKGIYAPGSIVKVWKEEARRAQEAIERGDESGGLHLTWRNEVFDVTATRC
ncbi:hypothetical protein T310_7087 [Rasamsonia emersonii CBS 393.64]|uniref:Bactericidal permeability-increasing protein n=1 Tax=Rasamsonia emersonii (strain ATCC 16479 / CBS 393.64 / IMI 116815) TaxID=1408163 RepID=A0A0F4YLF4_RASE3|nr:hypothetical protein T310_7087 [Rasamsonia emersonii CBS 393.64]KKA18945.1 hypothetical protein T310_7087 [Rasamsonia emersonii CBS 393.64]